MRIGVDISQLTFENTGVSNYLSSLLGKLLEIDSRNEYIFFFSSLRGKLYTTKFKFLQKPNVIVKKFKVPPTLLDLLWNKLHILSIENFIGDIDVFITSDWTEPPARKAQKATILYDLIVYKYPKETAQKIVDVQKRKLTWAKKESSMFFCISEATKKDAQEILGIDSNKLEVAYPGFN